MQKIHRLSLSNFKFFYGEHHIDFERKNLLIYGENGSGKSSIYWALYTFLQSIFKSNDEIKKYFDTTNEQNLVNRFASQTSDSSIVVEYIDEHESSVKKKISSNIFSTTSDNFLKEATQSSDFINYRLLSKLYDFSNRERIDLFPIFEREILRFVNFNYEFTPGNSNAYDWWTYIKNGLNPRPKMHESLYTDFQDNINRFNSEFERFLNNIVENSNVYLQTKFKQKLKIEFAYNRTTYNALVPKSTTKRDHTTIPPKIILSVSYLHNSLPELKKGINRPHSFLNEARLTTIALSIRLAVLDHKYIKDSPKILVLDDLLISLDMSNRDIVLELILNEFKNYQIIIMTHDRAFFNLIKKRIDYEGHFDSWAIKEIYQDENPSGIPIPFIPDNKDYIQRAEKYLREFDYPASANYLRKEAESQLKCLLPLNKTVKVTDEEGTRPLQLDTLLDNFKKLYVDNGGDFKEFKKLKEFKDILLNPLSHDNIDAPIYKLELLELKAALLKLRQLKTKTLVNIKDDPNTYIVLTEIDNNGESFRYKITLKENLSAFKLLDGTWKLSNPNCIFLKRKKVSDNTVIEINREQALFKGYGEIRYALKIQYSPPQSLFENVFNSAGENLNQIIRN